MTARLVERIIDLQARHVPLETFAAEMVPLLLDAFDAPAGALLLYQCEAETLVMVGSRGLSPGGRQHLENLRRGAADSWEIPLHGLLNRKAYVIERPDEHPFVPQLAARDVLPHAVNLASIPLYCGQLPVGVLLAIADRRPISERDILPQLDVFDALSVALDGYLKTRALSPAACSVESTSVSDVDGAALVDDATAERVPESPDDESDGAYEASVEPRELESRLAADLETERAARRALVERVSELEALLADAATEVEQANAERGRLVAERDGLVAERDGELERALAAERARFDRVTAELRDRIAAGEREQEAARAAESETAVRADAAARDVARLQSDLAEVQAEAGRLRDDRARVLAAVDEPGVEPAAVIRALREKVAALESEIAAHATERAELARRAASQAEQVAQQLASQRRETEELRAAHERALADLGVAHAHALDDAHGAHARAVGELRAAQERARTEQEDRQQALLATLRAEHADVLARVVAERNTVAEREERLVVQRDDLEARLAWALAEREEAAAGATVRERATLAQLEAEQHVTTMLRADREADRAAADAARAADAERLAAFAREVESRDERIATLAHDLAERDRDLAAARDEVARLCADRDRVLAVVDDPGAEPAAVIQALRERVADVESQMQALEAARAQAAERAAADVDRAEHRVALQRRELAEARDAHRVALEDARAGARRELETAEAQHRAAHDALAAAHRDEVAALRASGDRLDAERRTALAQVEADRDAALATVRELRATVEALEARSTEREQSIAQVTDDRARLEQALATAHDDSARLEARIADVERERLALESRAAALVSTDGERAAQLTALEAERRGAEQARREAEARAEQLATELAVVQAEALRLREDRARVLAAVDDESAEPAAVIRALREQVAALDGRLAAYAAERSELARRATAETRAAEERLAMARTERAAAETELQRELETMRTELVARAAEITRLDTERGSALEAAAAARRTFADAQRAHAEALAALVAERDALRAAAERPPAPLPTSMQAPVAAPSTVAVEMPPTTAGGSSLRSEVAAMRVASQASAKIAGAGASPADASRAADPRRPAATVLGATEPPGVSPAAPTIEVVSRAAHHILESDAARWEQISTALAALPVIPGRNLMVANLLAAFPAGLYDLTAAAKAGATLVGYAADAHGRSRILGAVRCFADPPTAAEAAAVFDALPKGPRRVLTLSEDVEAFIETKMGLTKAGHSVSMACDAKQAVDLLALFTPDAVFVDLRTAPNAAAEFLAALAPESGRVHVILVHGDPAGNVLPCVIQRLLRPTPLDPADLVQVCRNVLTGPPLTSPVRSAPVKAIRPLERPKVTVPRKPIARRLMPRRR